MVDSFMKRFEMKISHLLLNFAIMTLLLASGCAKQLGNAISEVIYQPVTEVLVQSVEAGATASAFVSAYYCRYGRWPNTNDELQSFVENELMDVYDDVNCVAISDANFEPLADGSVKITLHPSINYNSPYIKQDETKSRAKITTIIAEPNCVSAFDKNNIKETFISDTNE